MATKYVPVEAGDNIVPTLTTELVKITMSPKTWKIPDSSSYLAAKRAAEIDDITKTVLIIDDIEAAVNNVMSKVVCTYDTTMDHLKGVGHFTFDFWPESSKSFRIHPGPKEVAINVSGTTIGGLTFVVDIPAKTASSPPVPDPTISYKVPFKIQAVSKWITITQ